MIHCERWPASRYALQNPDHYLPMLYIIGMPRKDEVVTFAHEGFQLGAISYTRFEFG